MALAVFHRITPVRVIVNAAFAAPMLVWAFFMPGTTISAIASSNVMGPLSVLESIGTLVFVVIPFVYIAYLVTCGMRLRARANGDATRAQPLARGVGAGVSRSLGSVLAPSAHWSLPTQGALEGGLAQPGATSPISDTSTEKVGST